MAGIVDLQEAGALLDTLAHEHGCRFLLHCAYGTLLNGWPWGCFPPFPIHRQTGWDSAFVIRVRPQFPGCCGWFTEGFGTADLQEARAVLAELE